MKRLADIINDQVRERFWAKVARSEHGCWEWTGCCNPNGYGQLGFNHYPLLAHRVSYAIHYSDPFGSCVLHHCDNRKCVRPDHLFLGTVADNNKDMLQKGRARGGRFPGEMAPSAILKAGQVLEIRRRFVPGRRGDGTAAAREFGVSVQCIHAVLRRRTWRHL